MTYPFNKIYQRSRIGRRAIYPNIADTSNLSILGGESKPFTGKFAMDDIIIAPPQFTPLRLQKSIELIYREPIFTDVNTIIDIGGFKTTLPLVQSSMGSPEDWNKVAIYSAIACANEGLIYGIGENVASTWGYDMRKEKNQPCLLERIHTYLNNRIDGYGGIVIQQNEEDAHDELWNKLYSDPSLNEAIQAGLIAFEIKAGQGAKAGLGGEKIIDAKTAIRMKQNGYTIIPDPELVIQDHYERHSAPDIFTYEILKNRIKKLQNDYPRVKIWLKTGPYRDLLEVIQLASETGIDCISIDSKEGGTGMAPSVALQHIGISMISCLQKIRWARSKGISTSILISGKLTDGSDLVKSMSLGASGIAMGRPFLIAAYSYPLADKFIGNELYRSRIIKKIATFLHPVSQKSVKLIRNFIETVKIETQLIVSSLGKYHIRDVSDEDILASNNELSSILQIYSA
ncbi:MAG: glutamate synthase-related protein, partial [Candidatus Heimdallarchaeota archaeon]|nr:glutamate synthase-related protein [Candidatus Heimdallarchaeota archaeon]